jgi:hypothetical protein
MRRFPLEFKAQDVGGERDRARATAHRSLLGYTRVRRLRATSMPSDGPDRERFLEAKAHDGG